MGHKADKSFFDRKKPWSRHKDLVLNYYLPPYLAKVGRLGSPILLVDGFAGPGKFGDGSRGSPLIIAENAATAFHRGTAVRVLCIEQDVELYSELVTNTATYPMVECRNGTLQNFLPDIASAAETHTVFLYVDPYAIEGLDWAAFDTVFRHVQASSMSIEILMNFNAVAFVRRARAAMKMTAPEIEDGEDETSDPADSLPIGSELLSRAVGGDWWLDVLREGLSFPKEVGAIVDGVCRCLGKRFKEVCHLMVKERWGHAVPKYALVFGSRHPHALMLMNNAAARSREAFADMEKPGSPTLFETRPLDLVPDQSLLRKRLRDLAASPMRRIELVQTVMRREFGHFTDSEITGCIRKMLTEGILVSETGKAIINDFVRVWTRRS